MSFYVALLLLLVVAGRYHCESSIDIDAEYNATIAKEKKYCMWLCKAGWDSEFIQEIFPPNTGWDHLSWKNFLKYHNESTINVKAMVYNIENAHTDALHDEAIALVKRFRPMVLVHLSDEFLGDTGRKWRYRLGSILYDKAPLVLRSYGVSPYRSPSNPLVNVMQLPLGYISGMLNIVSNETNNHNTSTFENNSTTGITTTTISKLSAIDAVTYSMSRRAVDRNYSWSFVGGLKGHKERGHAIDVFTKWQPHYISHALASTEMRKVYNDSKFVLVGRGQANLDCFRIYEALICGAIPVCTMIVDSSHKNHYYPISIHYVIVIIAIRLLWVQLMKSRQPSNMKGTTPRSFSQIAMKTRWLKCKEWTTRLLIVNERL